MLNWEKTQSCVCVFCSFVSNISDHSTGNRIVQSFRFQQPGAFEDILTLKIFLTRDTLAEFFNYQTEKKVCSELAKQIENQASSIYKVEVVVKTWCVKLDEVCSWPGWFSNDKRFWSWKKSWKEIWTRGGSSLKIFINMFLLMTIQTSF